MPSHPSYQVVATTKIPLNDDNPLFSSSPPDPSTPPARQPPRPDLAIHRIRSTTRRNVTPLPSSITSPLQQIYSSSPPPPTSAQRQNKSLLKNYSLNLLTKSRMLRKLSLKYNRTSSANLFSLSAAILTTTYLMQHLFLHHHPHLFHKLLN